MNDSDSATVWEAGTSKIGTLILGNPDLHITSGDLNLKSSSSLEVEVKLYNCFHKLKI